MVDKQNPELQELRKIERQVTEIKERTGSPMLAFVSGLLYGAGWIIGGVLTVFVFSWVLSIMGVIPGLGKIAQSITAAVQYWHGGR